MITLAKRMKAIAPSATLALGAKAAALKAKGAPVVSFATGEPDFDTPAHIKDAAKKALDDGKTKYTPTGGIPELKAAIAQKFKAENKLSFAPEQVLVSCGAKHSLFNFFQALLSPGDEVVILSPYWVSYPEMVKLAEGVPVIVETRAEDGYQIDPAEFRRAIGPRTRAVVLNSPSNPTGAVLSDKSLEAIAEALRPHPDVVVVSDDIYERLWYVEGAFKNILNVAPDLSPRTVVVNGFSKAYAMTGWRLGYAAGPAELIGAMQKVQDQSTSNASSFSQWAAMAALAGPTDAMAKMVATFRARRDRMGALVKQIPGASFHMPEGAFYLFVNLSKVIGATYQGHVVRDSVHLSDVLLETKHVAAVAGAPFGAEGHLRLSFATSEANIDEGLGRLTALVRELT